MKKPLMIVKSGFVVAACIGSAHAGDEAFGYDWPPIVRHYGLVSDSAFGTVCGCPSCGSAEADWYGSKDGLADGNPDGIDFALQSFFGYHTNPAWEIKDFDRDAWYGGLRLSAAQRIRQSGLDVYWGASVRQTFYDRTVIQRENDDRSVTDFSARFGLGYTIQPSMRLSTFNRFDYSGHLNFGQGAYRYGLTQDEVLRTESRNGLDFRLDGADLGSTGIQFRTGVDYLRYDGDHNEHADFQRLSGTFQGGYILPSGIYLGGLAGISQKEWGDWDDFDSDGYLLGLRGKGSFPCGVDWQFRTGWEHRDYSYSGLRDRDEPFGALSISGEITDDLFIAYESYYGIGDFYQNQGGWEFIDAMTFRNSLSLVRSFGPVTGRVTYAHQYLSPEIEFTGMGGFKPARQEVHTVSVGADYKLGNGWVLGSEVGAGHGDYGFGGSDTYDFGYGSLQISARF